MSVEEKIKFEIKDAKIAGVYLPDRIEYDKFEHKYCQRVWISWLSPKGILSKDLKFKFFSGYNDNFFENILSIFSGVDLYKSRAFHEKDRTRGYDDLPDDGKNFIIKRPTEIKACFLNNEIVAIGDVYGSKWLEIDKRGFLKFYGGIEELKDYFIKKEKKKANEISKEKYANAISALEELVINLDDGQDRANIEEAIYYLNRTSKDFTT